MEMRRARNTDGKIEGVCKAGFAQKVLDLHARRRDLELSRKFFRIWMDKFTENCEGPSKRIEQMQSQLAVAGKSMRKSLAGFRKRLEERIYSIYCKSINTANVKKMNSFLMFVTNFKHFLRLNAELMEGCVDFYADLFDHVDKFTKGRGVTTGRLSRETDPFEIDLASLDEYNEWVANNVQEVFKSKRAESKAQKDDENARFLTLFRLLTIKFRADNPLTGGKKKNLMPRLQRILGHTLIGSLEEFFMTLK